MILKRFPTGTLS